tara:strand:+ start:1399 stop:5565 length:4167 start_codon:yes stop_codon:yes gene_type:complete
MNIVDITWKLTIIDTQKLTFFRFCFFDVNKNTTMCKSCHERAKQHMAAAAAKAKEFKDLAASSIVAPVEECRRCLEDGIFRRCCDNWYCNDCYYRIGECPSCNADTTNGKKKKKNQGGTGSKKPEAKLYQLLATNGIKLIYWIFFFGWPFTWFINKIVAYRTLHGFQCEGIFPQCKYEMCVSIHKEIENSSMPYYTSDMPECGSHTQCRRMCSKACVYDDRMFSTTHGKLGVDLCTSFLNDYVVIINDDFETFNEVSVNDTLAIPNSMLRDVNAQYQQNKEYLSSNWNTNIKGNPSIRQSSFWRDVQNGNPARICGSVHGNNALVFQGQLKRYAETVDLNIEYGANISFGFKFGGYVNSRQEPTHPACRGALRTPVSVRWSNDYGLSWNDLKFKTVTGGQVMITSFDETYVTEFMNNVTIEIDQRHKAATKETRFRWIQDTFLSSRDFWAIDNVTIITHTLPRDWEDSKEWLASFEVVHAKLKAAQCCFGSSQCPTWHSVPLDSTFCSQFPFWKERTELRATGAEMFTPHWFFLGVVGTIWMLLKRKCIPVKKWLGGAPKGKQRWGTFSKPGDIEKHAKETDQQEYLVWNSETRKNMEVVEFMISRDRSYQRNFFIVGPFLTVLFCVMALFIGLTRPTVRVDVANNLQGKKLEKWAPEVFTQFWIETHLNIPGLWLALVAAVLDFKDAYYIGKYCSGAFSFFKKHAPTRVQIYHHKGSITADDVQRLDRLVIDGDEMSAIPIGKIKKIETATAKYTKQLALTSLMGAMPWACCLQLLSRWLPDGIGLIWGVLVALKALTGPQFFSKLLLMWPYFFTMEDEHLTTTAIRFGQKRCLFLGIAFAFIGTIFIWPLVLIYFYVGNDNIISLMPDYLMWSFAIGLFVMFFGMGSLLGWSRDLPVDPWVYITGFEHMGRELEPTVITYTRDDSCFVNEDSNCYKYWTQDTQIILSVTDAFNFSEALKGLHLDYDREEERVVLRPGRRANVVLDIDYITFCRDEEVLSNVVAYDIAHALETTVAEILIEDYYKSDKNICITFTVADERAMEILGEYDTQARKMEFPLAGRYAKTEELKEQLKIRLRAHPWKAASKAYGYDVTPVDRFKVYNVAFRPMLDGYVVKKNVYKPPKKAEGDSDEDSFDAQLANMDAQHDKDEKARKAEAERLAQASPTSGDGSPGSGDGSPGSPQTGQSSYGSPFGTGSPGDGSPHSGHGSNGSSPGDQVGGHWNADGHEYPPEIRIMLAEIEESISPDRPLQCTRPWCRAKYSRNHNRSDACLYHPGDIKIVMMPIQENEMIEMLGPTRRIPRDTGRHEDYQRDLLIGPPERHTLPLPPKETRIWSCCGQPYVDLHNMVPTNPRGKELSVGKHGQHRGKQSAGFLFRENLPCTRCPHF